MGKGRGHLPLRTCISCGAKKGKKELIRLAVNERGSVVRDDLGITKGRGAYICKTNACGEELLRKRRLHRVFRLEGPVRVG